MKKVLITLMGLVAGAAFVHAQGTVAISGRPLIGSGNPAAGVFTNTSSFYAPLPATSTTSGPTTSGNTAPGAYLYALLIASSTTSGDSSPLGPDWTQAAINGGGGAFVTATNFATAAAGSVQGTGGSSGVAVAGWGPGATMNVMLVGWSSNLGTSWSAISTMFAAGQNGWTSSGFFGYSAVASMASGGVGSPASPAVSIFGPAIQGFDLFAVGSVPEPTTLALAGLGGLSMLFLRRRKA